MDTTTSPETQTAGRHLESVGAASAPRRPLEDDVTDPTGSLARRAALRTRHAERLARLMEERADLRGVHPLADFVDDSIRWTA